MKIHFNVLCHTRWGEQVYVTGSSPELGSWDATQAKRLEYSPGDIWRTELSFSEDTGEVEYRYLIKCDNGVAGQEGGSSRKFFDFKKNDSQSVELFDNWRAPSDPDHLFLTSAFSGVIFKRAGSKSLSQSKKIPARASQTRVRFQMIAPRVAPTDTLCILGSARTLGAWNPAKAIPLDSSQFPLWTVDLALGDGELSFNYKYVIKGKDGILYEEGTDKCFVVSKGSTTVISDEKFRYSQNWRGAGIAIPVFSLRSKQSLGVGEFLDLKLLVDWAAASGFQLIQLLPVNDTSVHMMSWADSYPYSGLSVFALHPIYLNLEAIGSLPKKILGEIAAKKKILNRYDHVSYEEVIRFKKKLLQQIFKIKKTEFLASTEFKSFFAENSSWLPSYAAFCYLRDEHGTSDYRQWGEYQRSRAADIRELNSPKAGHYEKIAFYYFVQYHLHRQMAEAADYAGKKRVVLKGDIPIGIDKHSDSCWTDPEFFNRDQSAGAPPDFFSEIGQNWGFPTYNWSAMARDGYGWWRRRLQQMSRFFQMIRLDHVLGFFRIWEVPVHAVTGVMGRFNPAIPLWKDQLEAQGIWDFNRLCEPYINLKTIDLIFGLEAGEVLAKYVEPCGPHQYRVKKEFATQKQVEAVLALPDKAPKKLKEKNERLQAGLFNLISDVIFFREVCDGKVGFHPRINLMDTHSYAALEPWLKEKLKSFYYDYFYHRQEDFWKAQAMMKLPVLKTAAPMLICGEDLGMIPACVSAVMEELSLIGLRIQRMPRGLDQEFGDPEEYSYLTICTTSSHDTSNLRAWWEEDRAKTERYYKNILGRHDEAPHSLTPEIAQEIIVRHLEAPSMWAIFPLQDILAMREELRRSGDPGAERINDPSNPHQHWRFRLHLPIESLIAKKDFSSQLSSTMVNTGRGVCH